MSQLTQNYVSLPLNEMILQQQQTRLKNYRNKVIIKERIYSGRILTAFHLIVLTSGGSLSNQT
jgi:hypothetical protein